MEEVRSHHLFWTGEESGQTVASKTGMWLPSFAMLSGIDKIEYKIKDMLELMVRFPA